MKSATRFILLALTTLGCAKSSSSLDLRPAATAEMTGQPGEAAVAAASGVEVMVNARAWNGPLPNLPRPLTPMFVRIENNSGSPLDIRYDQFELVNDEGVSWRAIPPMALDGRVRHPTDPVSSDLAPSPRQRDRHGPSFAVVPTPTQDLAEQALPEGIVAPGAVVSGFVYFQGVQSTDLGQLDFQASLLDARAGMPLATVEIPFITEDAFIGIQPEATAGIESDDEY